MDHISDIKLIRTDTTLDLSQKAEKNNATLQILGLGCGDIYLGLVAVRASVLREGTQGLSEANRR